MKHIPISHLDGQFDTPSVVTDARHQAAIIYNVQDLILNKIVPDDNDPEPEVQVKVTRNGRQSMIAKDKKKADLPKGKFEMKLTGNTILAGVGRITKFETVGERPTELGEVIILLSSSNLPAVDDTPIVFVNIEHLNDIPIEDFKKAGVSQIYARWKLEEEEHRTDSQPIKNTSKVQFDDHYAIPLEPKEAALLTAGFLDSLFEIEIRGIHSETSKVRNWKLFGQEKIDFSISTAIPVNKEELFDFPIAVTKIDASSLAKGLNGLVRGDFPLYPPENTVCSLGRERICTNDINAIRTPIKANVIVQPSIILRAQMTLEVTMGFVGCKPKELIPSFSRLYCLVDDTDTVSALLRKITEINNEVVLNMNRDCLLTGFVVDTGDKALFYIEGQRHGPILKIWHMVEDFYSKLKPLFSSSHNYASRLYPGITQIGLFGGQQFKRKSLQAGYADM
ncbi:uncharacterized protein LOC126975347 [Leptidea sinapis]|uniref:uncharacterized protein LOC126975347 n=1 Tax=Leptidea sinapis TaxID=189913 RepID=UPI0021250881|nr:uncharacterized protein LOC126975347 [Leptidea sinapis]